MVPANDPPPSFLLPPSFYQSIFLSYGGDRVTAAVFYILFSTLRDLTVTRTGEKYRRTERRVFLLGQVNFLVHGTYNSLVETRVFFSGQLIWKIPNCFRDTPCTCSRIGTRPPQKKKNSEHRHAKAGRQSKASVLNSRMLLMLLLLLLLLQRENTKKLTPISHTPTHGEKEA